MPMPLRTEGVAFSLLQGQQSEPEMQDIHISIMLYTRECACSLSTSTGLECEFCMPEILFLYLACEFDTFSFKKAIKLFRINSELSLKSPVATYP